MDKGDWGRYYICPKCGNIELPSFGNPWFLGEVCPECGEVVDKGRYARDNNMHTLRVVYDSIWYKPSTWGSHYYELLKEQGG